MIVHPEPSREPLPQQATAAVRADALTRIPAADFYGMAWAKDAIAHCSTLVARAAQGDRGGICRWVSDAAEPAGPSARYAVLRAVSDALIADACASPGAIRDVTAVMTGIESDVLAVLARETRRNAARRVNDPQTAALAGALAAMVRMNDRETAAHLHAVSGLSGGIAGALGLDADAVATIGLAGSLHDIGNIGVRGGVLRKPGALEPEEWRAIRSHAEAGARALEDLPGVAFLAPIVRAVHERIDGCGYPNGLRGDEIPLASRVIAVADAFAAMTAPRAFRPAMAGIDAAAILVDSAGTQFDAGVVEAALRHLQFARRSRRAIA